MIQLIFPLKTAPFLWREINNPQNIALTRTYMYMYKQAACFYIKVCTQKVMWIKKVWGVLTTNYVVGLSQHDCEK